MLIDGLKVLTSGVLAETDPVWLQYASARVEHHNTRLVATIQGVLDKVALISHLEAPAQAPPIRPMDQHFIDLHRMVADACLPTDAAALCIVIIDSAAHVVTRLGRDVDGYRDELRRFTADMARALGMLDPDAQTPAQVLAFAQHPTPSAPCLVENER